MGGCDRNGTYLGDAYMFNVAKGEIRLKIAGFGDNLRFQAIGNQASVTNEGEIFGLVEDENSSGLIVISYSASDDKEIKLVKSLAESK